MIKLVKSWAARAAVSPGFYIWFLIVPSYFSVFTAKAERLSVSGIG